MSDIGRADILKTLEARVAARAVADPAQSWTAKLIAGGPKLCAKKLGEEGVETALAIASGSVQEVVSEASDLLYHLCVALAARGVSIHDVGEELERRQAQTGLAEKAGRTG
jgi:phosphoribosyl-ATP pyrophosphohydrolase